MGLIRKPAASGEEEPTEIAVPLVYAFLKAKTEASYTTALQAVKDFAGTAEIPNITPPIVMLDLELALKNAVARVFPHSYVCFCFFYLGQAEYRRVQAEGLQE